MAKSNKKTEKQPKEQDKEDKSTQEKITDDNWFFLTMLAHNLLADVVQAIEKGDLVIPDKSSFNLEDFKNKVGLIEAVAQKTLNDQKEALKETDKKDKKLN